MEWRPIGVRSDPDEAEFRGDPADLHGLGALLDELVHRPAWMVDAACREHPGVSWFVARGEDVRPAKLICDRCLVRDECRDYAVELGAECLGLWGGTSERERKRLGRASTEVDSAA